MQNSHNFKIYNASAGAGKTYTLVRDFLAILLSESDSNHFKHILAITFTNKAANEMKVRILEKLKELASMDLEEEELKSWADELGISPLLIQQRAQRILTEILHKYALFSVSTIDKFNLRLMRAFSQDMGLSMNFDVEMNTLEMFIESVDVLFSELEKENLLAEIISDVAVSKLNEDKYWDISSEIVSNAGMLFKDQYQNELEKMQSYSLKEVDEFRKENYKEMNAQKQKMKRAAEQLLSFFDAKGLNEADFKGKSRGVYSYAKRIVDGKWGLMSATLRKNVEEGEFMGKEKMNLTDELSPEVIQKTTEISQAFLSYNLSQRINKTANSLTIFNEMDKKLQLLKKENNILLISDFNKIISDNLKDQPAPFIYERIGSRFRHYFVDEFQDTSTLQWNNLFPLIENANAQEDSVMIVGDPKQSIYRFRGGNPELMMALEKSEVLKPEVLQLEKNWRSHQAVITFNNRLFTFFGNSFNNENFKNLYVEGNQQKTNSKKGGFVSLNYLEKPEKGSELTQRDIVLNLLLEKIQFAKSQGFEYSEMAILVRNNKEGSWIAEFLAEKGIYVLSNESLFLNNSPEVQLLLSFAQFLSQPYSELYRSELLLNLFKNGKIKSDISELIIRSKDLDLEEWTTLIAQENIDLSFIHQPMFTLYDQMANAVHIFDIAEKGGIYINYFLDEILNFQNQNDNSVTEFLLYWEKNGTKKSVSLPEGQNAIQLMTIHKSKGLQFQLVFVPFTRWRTGGNGTWVPVRHEKVDSFYIDSLSSPESLPENVAEVVSKELDLVELDTVNLFYVACTRAVEQLYIFAEIVDVKKSNNTLLVKLNQFQQKMEAVEPNVYCFGSPERVSKPSEESSQTQLDIPLHFQNWSEKIAISREHLMLWDNSKADAVAFGNKVHSILEKIKIGEDLDKVLDDFTHQGYITETEKKSLRPYLLQVITHPKLASCFSSNIILNERDFIHTDGSLFRPDRMAKVGEEWVILDYKTGEPHKKYHHQIKKYSAQLEELGYSVQSKFLVYFSDEIKVEEVFD